MSWRDNLRPASFRGAAFKVNAHTADPAGRRVHVHEYPGRDQAFPEDMGKKTPEFTIEAYVLGDDYMGARDRLIEACAKAGPGTLVHPYLGTLQVACTGCQVSERTEEGRVARVRLAFVDAGENRYPEAGIDTAQAVGLKAESAETAAQARFAKVFSVANQPGFVADAAADLVTQAVAEISAAAGARTSGAFAVSAQSLIDDVATLVYAPTDLASGITGLVTAAAAETATARKTVQVLSPVVSFGGSLPAVAQSTATRILQAGNQAAFVGLVRRAAIIETARAAPSIDYAYSQEAFALRDRIGDALDGEMDVASAAADDDTFNALRALRAAVVADLNARAPKLARLVETVAAATEPVLVTSYRLYGDAGRADEVAARNRLRHPGFVPGGRALEVLSHV